MHAHAHTDSSTHTFQPDEASLNACMKALSFYKACFALGNRECLDFLRYKSFVFCLPLYVSVRAETKHHKG